MIILYDDWVAQLNLELKRRGIKSVDRIGIDLWEYFASRHPDKAAEAIIDRGSREQILFRSDTKTIITQLETLYKGMPEGKMTLLIECCILLGIHLYHDWHFKLSSQDLAGNNKISKMINGQKFKLFGLIDLALAGANQDYIATTQDNEILASFRYKSLRLANLLLIEEGEPLFAVCPQELAKALLSLVGKGCLSIEGPPRELKPRQLEETLKGCTFLMGSEIAETPEIYRRLITSIFHQTHRAYWNQSNWLAESKVFRVSYDRHFANTQPPYFTSLESFGLNNEAVHIVEPP